MSKTVVLTGLRANNDLHLGNYLGAMLPIIDLAKSSSDDYQINLFVPDLHSFTTPTDHSKLKTQTINNLRLYAAAGLPLDKSNVYIYRQSYIPAHSELTWILDCFTGMGEMGRMTQFKEKSAKFKINSDELKRDAKTDLYPGNLENYLDQKQDERISVGLFNYPVLMAADILLYDANYVPVGDDQTQHLEFTRDIAERMNKQFGKLFTVPMPVKQQHAFFGKDQGLRVMDLMNPTKKMSKSDETGKGVLFLNDSPAIARKKIMSATTDSYARIAYNKAEQPGISNLIDILALLTGKTPGQVSSKYINQENYGNLKSTVADSVENFLAGFQKRLEKVDDNDLRKKLEAGERSMNNHANKTLLRVQKAIGIR